MSNRLSSIIKKKLLDAETITFSKTTEVLYIGEAEGGYAAQLIWTNGSTPNISVKLEVSLNGINFVEVDTQPIIGTSGTELWDITDTFVEYLRFSLVHVSGSADVTILFNGKSRH